MNAPHINVKYIHSHPMGSLAWMEAIRSEEKRCCGQIDARIHKLQAEEHTLYAELESVEKRLETEQGFFARIRLVWQRRRINQQLEWRRKALDELIDARITRTYA